MHGESARMTIYCYLGGCALIFGLGGYFSISYIRIRNAQKKSSQVIVPEKCEPDRIICSSCLYSSPVYLSEGLLCPKCKGQMEEINGYLKKHTYLNEVKKKDAGFNAESVKIIFFMIIFMSLLLMNK